MRIARLLDPDTGVARVALERDDAYYDVARLEAELGMHAYAPELPWDFHTRVVALGCAGLRELDSQLLAGKRPQSARVVGQTPLAPCDTERANLWFAIDPGFGRGVPAWPRLGHARSLAGQDALVDLPESAVQLDAELFLAVLVDEDLESCETREARAAIAGYSVLMDWVDQAAGGSGLGLRSQLGPVLVTPERLPRFERLVMEFRGDFGTATVGPVTELILPPERLVAAVSERVRIAAGDVVALGPLSRGSLLRSGAAESLAWHDRISGSIRELGSLRGTAVPRRAVARRD